MTVQTRLTGSDYPLKLSAREFLARVDAGLFERWGRTELIEGEVWIMNAVHRWHSRVNAQFIVAISEGLKSSSLDLIVYGPGSVAMSDDSVPEPDISVGIRESSSREPISLWAVKIAVELSDTTRNMDLGRKATLYAQCGVPEYWVADREAQVLVRHSSPTDGSYAEIVEVAFGEAVTSATLPGLIVETGSLLD